MATKVRIVLSSAGITQMLKSTGVVAMLHERAQAVASAARSAAPRVTGDYAASIAVVEEIGRSRAVARVVADSPHALRVEAAHRVLGNALGGGDGLVEYVSKSGKKSRITQKQADNYSKGRR